MPVRDRVAPAVLIAALLLTGCGPGSPPPAASGTPTSTVTPDAEEAAFRAAEATYRAYVDALNAVDLSDPATFEPVFALTTGRINDEDRRALSGYHSAGVTMTGSTEITEVRGNAAGHGSASLLVCVDVSSIEMRDQAGTSIVQSDREPLQQLLVSTRLDVGMPSGAVITDVVGSSEEPGCSDD